MMQHQQKEELIFVGNHPYMLVDDVYIPAVFGGAEETDDLAKVQDFIKSQVETYFQEQVQKTPAIQQVERQTARESEDAAQKQLRELISPFVDPALNEARLTAADSMDYVKFYTNNPEAAEYQEAVEKTFEALKKAGRPLPREDILAHTIGKEYRTAPEKFTEKLSAKRQAQLERAESASDIGGMSTSRAKNDGTFGEGKFDKLSVEDMEKALEGITF